MRSGLLDLPSGAEPVNNSRSNRFATICATKLIRLFRRKQSAVLFLTSKLCVKYGGDIDLAEAQALQFIAAKTSIPVPKVHCAFQRKGQTYIVMERVRGSKISDEWSGLAENAQDKILLQLKDMVAEMRSIPAPDNQIASVGRGSLWNSRLPIAEHRFGPFRNAQSFHKFLWSASRDGSCSYDEKEDVVAFLASCDPAWNSPKFTHGDLNSMNILIRDGQIVSILDWETAGWYPEYWEYNCAVQVNPWNIFWKDCVPQFLEPHPEALLFERCMLQTGKSSEVFI